MPLSTEPRMPGPLHDHQEHDQRPVPPVEVPAVTTTDEPNPRLMIAAVILVLLAGLAGAALVFFYSP